MVSSAAPRAHSLCSAPSRSCPQAAPLFGVGATPGRRSAPAVSLSRLQGDLVDGDELGRRRHSHAAHPLEEPDQRDFLRSGCHLRHHHGAAHRHSRH